MTETAFTPGPWWACFGEDQPVPYYRGLVMYVSSDPHISICTGDAGDKSGSVTCERGEWEANARLVAAAPELYEALLDLIENPEKLSAHKNARAVLAKARGETS